MSVFLCLLTGCAIAVLFVVGGSVLAVGYGTSRFLGPSEALGWDDLDDLPEWERDS